MTDAEVIAATEALYMNVARREPLVIRRGQGPYVFDGEGRRYLDFFAGISVVSVGHCHPRIVAALKRQAELLWHVSNHYYTEPQAELLRRLAAIAPGRRIFLCNSGAEANEGAVKLARKWGRGRYEVITLERSFHGRTLAMLAATGQPRLQAGFEPLPEGFRVVAPDLEAVAAAVGPRTVAILVEPVQGEGGVHPLGPDLLRGLRALCDERDLLLIFDEVQTGLGRAGWLLAEQGTGVRPDIFTLAKALGGGIAVGAVLADERVAQAFGPGDHGSTFGGGALACAAAAAVLDVLQEEDLPGRARRLGPVLGARLEALRRYPEVRDVRGLGLMWGVELDRPVAPWVAACREEGLIVGTAGPNVLRLLPPLVIGEREIEQAGDILERTLARLGGGVREPAAP